MEKLRLRLIVARSFQIQRKIKPLEKRLADISKVRHNLLCEAKGVLFDGFTAASPFLFCGGTSLHGDFDAGKIAANYSWGVRTQRVRGGRSPPNILGTSLARSVFISPEISLRASQRRGAVNTGQRTATV